MRKFRRAAQLTPSDWRCLTTATLELLAARIRFSTVLPERLLQELQDRSLSSLSQQPQSSTRIDVEKISWSISIAARHVPWRSDCLIQTIAADRWLGRHRLKREFFLGVAKDGQEGLDAHAWLRCRNFTVTGGACDRFTILIGPESEFRTS